ncbi:MAG: hypothetical protein H6742_03535 [Alphaproteobacteria bacterium]|nr:hypothetical protein [Alphaproteobacteria bacterium]
MISSLLALLLTSPAALAWGHHALVMDRTLEHPQAAWTATEVPVESLDDLLADAAGPVAAAIDAHYDWLDARGSTRFQRQSFPVDAPTRDAFLRACRLNPAARLPLVVRVLPGQDDAPGFAVAPEAASRYLHAVPPLAVDIHVVPAGTRVSARAVLSTFVDEPDWGFDHELWGITAYGYGEQPFGKATGESSKAPFHMQFDHENVLTKAFTDLDEAMVRDRVDLFLRLSRAAFVSGHDYWGLRFAAWASHYVQDLAQPYHSRALPSAPFSWYVGYVFSGNKEQLEADKTQLAANRHFVYEDFVAYGLQQSYVDDAPLYAGLLPPLREGDATLSLGRGSLDPGDDPADALVTALTKPAAKHAPVIAKTLRSSFPARLMEDPTYDVETAPDYAIVDVLAAVPADAAQVLLAETGADFGQAARATRSVLELVGAEAALAD